MTDTIAYLEAIVGADVTSFRRGMAEVRAELTETAGLGSALSGLGEALTLGLTVPIVAIGAIAVKSFADLDSAMRNVNSIMQLPEAQFQKLNDQVVQFGASTRNGATAAATALYAIVSAGFGVKDTAQAMQLLAVASKTAEAGLADELLVAQTLATSLLAYGQGADQASHFADILTQAVNLGVGSMSDFASGMGQAINIAALAKVSFSDLSGSAAFLTQHGMSAAEAYTALNQLITQLIKPTTGLKDAFAQLGVTGGTELIQKFGGLGGALQALGSVSGTSADALAGLFTNVRALRGAASILGNFSDYTDLMTNFGDAVNGVTDRAQQQQLMSFSSQFDYMKSAIGGALDVIGKQVAPLLTPLIDGIKNFGLAISQVNPEVVQFAIKLGVVLALVGPILTVLGALITSGLLPLVAIIGLVGTAFNSNFLGIRDDWENIVKPALELFVNEAQIDLNLILFYVNYFGNQISDAFKERFQFDMTGLLADVLVGDWDGAKEKLSKIWDDIKGLFWDKFAKPIGDFIDSLGPERFGQIALGISVVAGSVIAFGVGLAIANIPTGIAAISAALVTLLTTGLGPVGIAVALGIGLLLAYQNNWLHFRDIISGITVVFDAFAGDVQAKMKILTSMAVVFGFITGGPAGAQAVLDLINKAVASGSQTLPSSPAPELGALPPGGFAPPVNPIKFPGLNVDPNTGVPAPSGSAIAPGTGFGPGGVHLSNVQVNIHTNNVDQIFTEMRRQGVDLKAAKRG